MYCSNCGKKIFSDAKFCYNCGKKLNIKVDNTKNFFIDVANNKMIKSKNKYYNMFILLSIVAVSSVFIIYLYKSLFSSFNSAMELVNLNSNFVNVALLRSKTEFAFRDVWCILILIGIFISVLIACFTILVYLLLIKLKIKFKRRKN